MSSAGSTGMSAGSTMPPAGEVKCSDEWSDVPVGATMSPDGQSGVSDREVKCPDEKIDVPDGKVKCPMSVLMSPTE